MKKLIFGIILVLIFISVSFASVQDVSNLTKLIKSIENESVFDTLSSISKISGTESDTGKATVSTINAYWPTISIIDQFGSGIDLDNVTYLYINFERLNNAVGSYSE